MRVRSSYFFEANILCEKVKIKAAGKSQGVDSELRENQGNGLNQDEGHARDKGHANDNSQDQDKGKDQHKGQYQYPSSR